MVYPTQYWVLFNHPKWIMDHGLKHQLHQQSLARPVLWHVRRYQGLSQAAVGSLPFNFWRIRVHEDFLMWHIEFQPKPMVFEVGFSA